MRFARLIYFLTFLLSACVMVEVLVLVHLSAVLSSDFLLRYAFFFPWFVLFFGLGLMGRENKAGTSIWITSLLRTEAGMIVATISAFVIFNFLKALSISAAIVFLLILLVVAMAAYGRGREVNWIIHRGLPDPARDVSRIHFYSSFGFFAAAWLFVLLLLPFLGLTASILYAGAIHAAGLAMLYLIRDQIAREQEQRFYNYLYFHLILSVSLAWAGMAAIR